MTTPNFNEFRMRCSAIGALMTEPQLKADKEAGNLSATAKTALIKEYSRMVDERMDDIFSKPMQKGTQQEDESITTLSLYDGKFYVKNEQRLKNEFISGECDIDDNQTPNWQNVDDAQSGNWVVVNDGNTVVWTQVLT